MAIVYWPPQSSSSSSSVTAPETIVLADATTNTAPDVHIIQHTTSGTAAAGFGVTEAIELESAGGTTRRVTTETTTLTTATDGSEVAQVNLQIMSGGTLRDWGTFLMATAAVQALYLGAAASLTGFQRNSVPVISVLVGGTTIMQWAASGTTIPASRFSEKQGAAVASASTLTLGADGNYFHITGTTTINYLTTTNWQAGSHVVLYFDSAALTVTNNAGSVPGNTFAFELAGAVNITTTAGMKVSLRMDSTQSKWVEISRSA